MSKLTKALTAAAGNAGESLYVEDVFSTYLVTGTNAAVTVNNGLDLDGKGGMVWVKKRSAAGSHNLYDTERGANNRISSNNTNAQDTKPLDFTSTGFSDFYWDSGVDYTSWSFRKAEKFFDVVTWTGNSTVGRTVAHNLGVAPAWMVIKSTNAARNWCTYHISLGNGYQIILSGSAAKESTALWNYTTPTATEFTLGNDADVNGTGNTYVAYLFASDAGGFGDDGDENIIKCGSYTGNTSNNHSISVGFEPQWLMIKDTSSAGNPWAIYDSMRGTIASTTDYDNRLEANASSAEQGWPDVAFNADGFTLENTGSRVNGNGENYIYIAIRRPMKTPEAGTEVFLASTVASGVQIATGFNVDLWINGSKDGSAGVSSQLTMDRMRGAKYLRTTQTTADTGTNNPFTTGPSNTFTNITQGGVGVAWMFKRATGFMDAVAYSGTNGTISRNHNLGVAPELMITKRRDSASAWTVLSELDGSSYSEMSLNSTIDKSTRTYASNQYLTAQPTATVFAQAASYDNESGGTYITYLFATLAGVSKVGSYTGNAGYAVNVDCGFSAGARFILIKRTDSTGDWYTYDSARGIVAGNDPYLLLNSTAAEVTNTDYIDPLASGFTVTSSAPAGLNASGGSYIFLAIA